MTAVLTSSIEAAETDADPVTPWIDLGYGVALSPNGGSPGALQVLTDQAVRLIATLHRSIEVKRQKLLATRESLQREWDDGDVPSYLDPDSEAVQGAWQVAEIPPDLRCRRVEITGPVNDAKMVINMLSRNEAGYRADCAMVDFEDSMKPSWANVVAGIQNVAAAARKELCHVRPASRTRPRKEYALDSDDMAKLLVRVRGLHLDESNLRVDGAPVSAGLFDLALCLLHGAAPQLQRGETPAFYVPKVEHHLEARWWNLLFVEAQQAIGLEPGTLRATFLIETLPAAFQMEEILFEVREHAAGLNVGRWDKIFSDIKVLKTHPDRVMADRGSIGMNRRWMRNYATRLIRICHKRGAYAIGGMAAFTPGRTPELRQHQTSKVLADKKAEFQLGHDGCWVSHPFFIGPALTAFPKDQQLDVRHEGQNPRPELLPGSTPPYSLNGLRTNVRVGIAYLEGWRRDIGCVAWDDLMEDLATLEISRAQTWQWLRHGVTLEADGLEGGLRVDEDLVRRVFDEELDRVLHEIDGELEDRPEQREARRASFLAAQQEALDIFTEKEFRPFLSSASNLA
ncbi:MAG: malate synthase [Thermoanaerobaculia bacterium]|nr:malate synthase [Thermoanaerobaculia bacterium]